MEERGNGWEVGLVRPKNMCPMNQLLFNAMTRRNRKEFDIKLRSFLIATYNE